VTDPIVDLELALPDEIVDELRSEGLPLEDARVERRTLESIGHEVVPVMVTIFEVTGRAVVVVDAVDHARRIAAAIGRWRRRQATPATPYVVGVRGPNGNVKMELMDPPDVDALAAMLRSAMTGRADGE
jgi:hypothetical protein